MTASPWGRPNEPAKVDGRHWNWVLAASWILLVVGVTESQPITGEQLPDAPSAATQSYPATVGQPFSPVLDLDFETLGTIEGSLSSASKARSGEERTPAVNFRLELGDEIFADLRDKRLDELGLYLLDDLPLSSDVPATERQRQRWYLLERRNQTEQLQDELQDVLASVKGDLRLEIGLRLGDLLLRTGHPARARTIFQQLLVDEGSRDGAVQQLRQRIVLSYFDEGRFYDAATFAEQLTAEFAPDQPSWLLLRALIALSLGRPEEAVRLLREETSIEGKLWRIFARWQNQLVSATTALVEIGQLKIPADGDALLALRSAVIVQLAKLPEHARTRALALESLAQSEVKLPALLRIDAKTELLTTYVEIAHLLLAREGISLVALDVARTYQRRYGPEDALGQRSLAVALLLQEKAMGIPISSDSWLIRHLIEAGVPGLIPVLFGKSGIAANMEEVSAESLMLLVDEALGREDLPSAAQLQARIETPAPGVDLGEWTVRTARIHVLGGNAALGASQLGDWLSGLDEMTPAGLDRVMQILFDLQFIGEHRLALGLFEVIAPLVRTANHRRELFYWSAQSWVGLEEYARGAAFFLESARLSGDQHPFWQKSALYQAAKALEAAALYEDAAAVYKGLLGGSAEPKMQAKLRYRLAQIERRRTEGNSE
ncbi:MAG: hypothetical protein EVB04_05080 [Candidatus Thioglobus sp.]|nr:MAG: hypothetical protein EVB04_05080 [Candidatus Thioglobus sp.]